MKPLFALSFASILGLNCIAQMPKDLPDAKAKGILDELSKKTKAYTTIKAEFSIVTTDPKGATKDNTSGTMYHKSNKYKLEVKGQTIYCDGTTQWTYIKEDNMVQINDAPDPSKSENINPANIFTIYEKGFKYKFDKEEVQNGISVYVVNLYPLEPGKRPYHTVRLTIDKVKMQVLQVKVMNKDGNNTTISVKSFTPNADMPDATFVFNKAEHKGVTEEDLREH